MERDRTIDDEIAQMEEAHRAALEAMEAPEAASIGIEIPESIKNVVESRTGWPYRRRT